jgi:predicted nucleic acid-binding protein
VTVIADTSPLNYLILIDAQDLLPSLYASIRIAPAGASELAAPGAPEKVRQWIIEDRPDWLVVTAPRDSADPRLAHLHRSEREAISLAMELSADLVLIDDRDGRAAAQVCGLTVAGTLRVLADAAAVGLIDLAEAFARLRSTTFRADPRLMDRLLRGSARD